MRTLTAGITRANESIEGVSWDILGQTYVAKSLSENAFSWHATFPPGTFVPPHSHSGQDEYLYILEGRASISGSMARRPRPARATPSGFRLADRTASSTSPAAR